MRSGVDVPVAHVRRTAVIVGLVAYLATGFVYVTSGLVVPGAGLAVRSGTRRRAERRIRPAALVARWSWWAWAAAPAAFALWLYLLVGENLFGWTA